MTTTRLQGPTICRPSAPKKRLQTRYRTDRKLNSPPCAKVALFPFFSHLHLLYVSGSPFLSDDFKFMRGGGPNVGEQTQLIDSFLAPQAPASANALFPYPVTYPRNFEKATRTRQRHRIRALTAGLVAHERHTPRRFE